MKLSEHITRAVDFFYIKPFRRIVPQQVFRYTVCGGGNLLLGWLLYWVLYNHVVRGYWLDLGITMMSPHILTLFIQFPVTFFTGFWLNRHVTFSQSPLRGRTQLFRYMLSVAGSFLLVYMLMKLFVEVFCISPPLAKPLTDAVVVIYSFCASKFFTFRGSRA